MTRVLATATFALLAGCGYVGPPLPPALNIPKPVADLRVEQIGDKIIIHFTPPKLTTENIPVTDLRAITLYAGPGEAEFSRDRWSATAHRFQVPVTATDFPLPATDWVGQDLVLSIRSTGRTGRESDWSKYEYISVGTPLTAPSNILPSNVPDAIFLKWEGNAPRYRVLRSIEGKLEPIGEVDTSEFTDRSIVYGMHYEYVIVGIAGANRQSLPSVSAAFTPADVFPPAVPPAPTAVASTGSVDLSWTRSPDDDLAGYNIFRAIADGPFEPLAQRVLQPAYTDTRVESGKRYRYKVSALDMTGNESDRSPETIIQLE